MTSRPVLQTAGYNAHVGNQSSPIPPPPRDTIHSSPLSRQNVLNPPTLTTAVSSTLAGSYNSTPLSGVPHQSPFSPFASSPVVMSAGTPLGPSPMPARQSSHFSVPYDPRDWAPGTDRRANQAVRARENAAENGLASPPPPYSPAMAEQQDGRSPRPHNQSAQNASASQTPVALAASSQRRTMPAPHAPPNNRHSIHMGYHIPPPPSHSPGLNPTMPRPRIVSDIQNGFYTREDSPDLMGRAPGSRRSASAHAEMSHTVEAGPSRSSSRNGNWVPGMPLPGPPPGPPPSTSRSHSTSAAIDRQNLQSGIRPRPLRQTVHLNELGPVPPTPANWTDGQPMPNNHQMALQIDTVNVSTNPQHNSNAGVNKHDSTYYSAIPSASHNQPESSSAVAGISGNLARSSAVRDSSAQGIRERRAQSRNSMILNADFNALSVQTDAYADAVEQTEGADSRHATPPGSGRLNRLRPKALSPLAGVIVNQNQVTASPIQMHGTPPVSPLPPQPTSATRLETAPPKALPTPPLSQKNPLSAHSTMPPARETFPGTTLDDLDSFQRDATRRHIQFLEREKLAASDADRLQLFADYVLKEALIRQKKYEPAILNGEFDVEALRQSLFKPAENRNSTSLSVGHKSVDGDDTVTANTPSAPSRPETMWWKDYQPALSPIASMDYDEMSSRGRAPSRWWESQTGSQSAGVGPRTVQRSKRESKFMGLSKEFLMTHSPSDEFPNFQSKGDTIMSDPNAYPNEKANPETFGYFDDGNTPRRVPATHNKMPASPALLDISRFITLTPPYPRHYPAVNNNHPDLANYRTTVRSLGDLEEIKTRKSRHNANTEALKIEHKRKMSDSRRSFRSNVQAQIEEGSITFAEAAEAEEAFKMSELSAEKQRLQAEFDTLQDVVINPLHDMLHERISQLNVSIQQLQDDLHTEARYQDPDRPQEEGDETPELLEKLTQLKWLFDVREQIHRECFALLSERNNTYKNIVLLPYQFTKNAEKVRDTELFFNRDNQDRYLSYCHESLTRHENFLQVIEQHVRRGVELQSSAFWDIAPGLVDLLQKIPEDLRNFQGIYIPEKEYSENPSYHEHPQQYLYLLLSHAEKSTYQFIEGQTNLQCLLHEVKTATLSIRYRNLEAGNVASQGEHNELDGSKSREEAALTAELKQKAAMIEEQWLEALGSQLQATRDRVRALLQENNAWEEIASDDP